MTLLLEKALEAVRLLPADAQDHIARAMLLMSGEDGGPEAIDPAHLPDVMEGLDQVSRGQFASQTDVEAVFRRFER